MANESFALGEKTTESMMVQKVLRSLPSKAIEEANDITIMKLDELFGSLHTFEFSFKDQGQKKKNGITFQSICEDT